LPNLNREALPYFDRIERTVTAIQLSNVLDRRVELAVPDRKAEAPIVGRGGERRFAMARIGRYFLPEREQAILI